MTTHKLVPIEPTEEMIDAGYKSQDPHQEVEVYATKALIADAYRAMLSAAPPQENLEEHLWSALAIAADDLEKLSKAYLLKNPEEFAKKAAESARYALERVK